MCCTLRRRLPSQLLTTRCRFRRLPHFLWTSLSRRCGRLAPVRFTTAEAAPTHVDRRLCVQAGRRVHVFSVCLSIFLSVCLSVCVCLSSVCLYVCLSAHMRGVCVDVCVDHVHAGCRGGFGGALVLEAAARLANASGGVLKSYPATTTMTTAAAATAAAAAVVPVSATNTTAATTSSGECVSDSLSTR